MPKLSAIPGLPLRGASQPVGLASAPAPAEAAPSDDPIKAIQLLIHESHIKLTAEVEGILVKYENNLRSDIKEVLRRHATGIDKRKTPLDKRATPGNR